MPPVDAVQFIPPSLEYRREPTIAYKPFPDIATPQPVLETLAFESVHDMP